MQVDYALILSAGLGTRMGELGKVLPKVLWPIFSKSLLQLQIDYCSDLGINNVYINVHFLADEIKKHLETMPKSKMKITILHEDPLLDSGGAIHNLAMRDEVNYQGNLLLINGDQFLFFNKDVFKRAIDLLKSPDIRATLFGILVKKSESYNETVIENELLKDIQKNKGECDYITYSGLGIVKLGGLSPVAGISKFFQTVVNYKLEKTYMITPKDFEYWDFGTAEIYCQNIFKIINKKEQETPSLLKNFLAKHSVDFSNHKDFLNAELNSIDLDRRGRFQLNTMISKSIRQKI